MARQAGRQQGLPAAPLHNNFSIAARRVSFLVCDTRAQGGFKTWKKRWFVLVQGELSYYAQSSRKELKGSMIICDCEVVRIPEDQVRAALQLF